MALRVKARLHHTWSRVALRSSLLVSRVQLRTRPDRPEVPSQEHGVGRWTGADIAPCVKLSYRHSSRLASRELGKLELPKSS